MRANCAEGETVRGQKNSTGIKYGDYKFNRFSRFPSQEQWEDATAGNSTVVWVDGYSNAWHKRSHAQV
ncbi:MAG: hypothetical protein IPH33_00010 [Bacteroidetes bacterium]|nr:hypothetical protein [Bacteroidota bacterium]